MSNAAVGERQVLGPRDDVRPHAGRRVGGHDLEPGLAQPSGDVAATGRDVERGPRALRPTRRAGRDPRPPGARRTRRTPARAADQTSLMPPAPRRAAPPRASSARRAGSAARPRRGSRAPPRRSSRRAGRRSGRSISICASACRIPRATSSQRVIPPKMLKKIAFTCGSRVITSSASTTPCASPPPPRSQKFAGRPPAKVTTSTVDIVSPAPLPSTPDLAVELDVGDALLAREPLERVAAAGRASAATSGWRKSALSSTVNFESSALHLAVRRDDQRVDLAEHRVAARRTRRRASRRSRRSASAPTDPRRRRRRRGAAPGTGGSPRAGRRGAARARPGSSRRPPRCRSRPAS